MNNIRVKAQASFFVKILFIVISAIAFVLVIVYFSSFRKSTIEEKEAANFKMETMNVLQKLVSDKDCLAYEYNETSQKIVIDKNKLDSFASIYSEEEPNEAKALNFDYNIKISQPEYNFSLYPGDTMVQGELTLSNEFSSHSMWGGVDPNSNIFVYFDCNFNPKDHPNLCENTELDWIVCPGCDKNPREECPYPHQGGRSGICCIYWQCPKDACGFVEIKKGMGDCGSGCTVATDCDLSRCQNLRQGHGACGMTYEYIWIPTGETKHVDIHEKVWSFGLSLGVESFSPEKAKKEELDLSLPVTIRYNDTFSAEGTIYIHAVRGELESFYSLLEYVCEKAKEDGNSDIKFSREFHFSYPVTTSGDRICMLDSCKKFVCPYYLEFDGIRTEGDHLLNFEFDSSSKTIKVGK